MIFAFGYSRQRQNHVRLVFQNILAGQELSTTALVIYDEDVAAKETSKSVLSLLEHARKLALGLCDKGTTLSAHNLEEQLRANKTYRDLFSAGQVCFPRAYSSDFGSFFVPNGGWKKFDKEFRQNGLATLKRHDPFWPGA